MDELNGRAGHRSNEWNDNERMRNSLVSLLRRSRFGGRGRGATDDNDPAVTNFGPYGHVW